MHKACIKTFGGAVNPEPVVSAVGGWLENNRPFCLVKGGRGASGNERTTLNRNHLSGRYRDNASTVRLEIDLGLRNQIGAAAGEGLAFHVDRDDEVHANVPTFAFR